VPEKCGVYMFKDEKGKVLYIGKAKNLKLRLRSYFQSSAQHQPRIIAMLHKVKDFSFIVTDNELEAFILEANLIKEQKPRYNIILKDDKNYPYLKLTINEKWPRIEIVRKIKKDGALYFGPYIPASCIKETISFIKKHFKIRACNYNLNRKLEPCIQYQIKRCSAPCAGMVSEEDYMKSVKEVEYFLKGKKKDLILELEQKMKKLASELRFEEAAYIRDRIQSLKIAFESQKVISPEFGDMDLIGFYQERKDTAFVILFIRNGILIGTKEFFLKDTGYMSADELFEEFMKLFYIKDVLIPDEIITQNLPKWHKEIQKWLSEKCEKNVKVRLAKSNKEKELLQMAQENAKVIFTTKISKHIRNTINTLEILRKIKHRLNLKKIPKSIGAFDVSNMHGSHSVGAFIWWEKEGFFKEFYRHLKIKTVSGIDDYCMMAEIVKRTLNDLDKIPDLILIDGGKGHLKTAIESAKEILNEKFQSIDIVAIAKKPDRVILHNGKIINIQENSPDMLLLRKIRDEVHRFAITFHRKLRNKSFLQSPLEKIRGIGNKRRFALLKHFGSVEAIKNASIEEIVKVDNMNTKLAQHLLNTLNKK